MQTLVQWAGVLLVPAVLASCAEGQIEEPEQRSAVVATIDLGEGHRIEFLRDPEGHLFYAEQGNLGSSSVGAMLARTSAPDIWRELVPGEPVPAALAGKAVSSELRGELPSAAASPAVLRKGRLSPRYEAVKEPLCKCDPMKRVGEAYPWIACWQDHTGPSYYPRNDTIGAESGFCNRSFYPARFTVKHRTYIRWVTDVDRDIDNFKWERVGKVGDLGGLFDFDWRSQVTPLSTPEPVHYDHVVTGVAFD